MQAMGGLFVTYVDKVGLTIKQALKKQKIRETIPFIKILTIAAFCMDSKYAAIEIVIFKYKLIR